MAKYGPNPLPCDATRVPALAHYEAIRKEIIRLMQVERERRNLSRYAVAQNSGVSESMLSLIERGLRNPTLELVLRISDGIGTDLPDIIAKAKKVRSSAEARPIASVDHSLVKGIPEFTDCSVLPKMLPCGHDSRQQRNNL